MLLLPRHALQTLFLPCLCHVLSCWLKSCPACTNLGDKTKGTATLVGLLCGLEEKEEMLCSAAEMRCVAEDALMLAEGDHDKGHVCWEMLGRVVNPGLIEPCQQESRSGRRWCCCTVGTVSPFQLLSGLLENEESKKDMYRYRRCGYVSIPNPDRWRPLGQHLVVAVHSLSRNDSQQQVDCGYF